MVQETKGVEMSIVQVVGFIRTRISVIRHVDPVLTPKKIEIRHENKVVARNPVWGGVGNPTDSQRKELMAEISKINKDVFEALA